MGERPIAVPPATAVPVPATPAAEDVPALPAPPAVLDDAVFVRALAQCTKPHPRLPQGYIHFDKNALAQPELETLMGYDDDVGVHPSFIRRSLAEVASFGHAGLVQFMNDALQEYLHMELNLKGPECTRMTEEEKLMFDSKR